MLATFGLFDPPELIIILVIILIIFGPGKIPDIGKALGKGLHEFRKATGEGASKLPKNDESKQSPEQEKLEK